ncbi:hypothetical protein EV179_003093 [Coemansia sp. RSA 487]|nr:hypothetical protein EV179_003093 [Coemansia sp. RSA 487]
MTGQLALVKPCMLSTVYHSQRVQQLVSSMCPTVKSRCSVGRRATNQRWYAAPVHKFEKYDPSVIENDWYKWWQKQGLFSPKTGSAQDNGKKNASEFSMLLPPPNVTGVLHIGHALTLSIQDAIARWNRMNGRNVNWVPGMDHAGISLQSVVEKKLKRDTGQTKYDLGRKAFVDLVWEYKRDHGDRIKQQIIRVGASLNWDSEYYTMDPRHSRTVREAFIRLYEDGLIYRATKMVNWSCALQSVISDIEVDKIPTSGCALINVPDSKTRVEFGVLHTIQFPIVNPPEIGPSAICVETTRPETMLGDVALAVNSADARYKITPAHDANDYECAQRHGLPVVQVFGNDGKIVNMSDFAEFVGKSRWEARRLVIKQLMASCAYLGKRESEESVISICSRSGDVIEPMLMPQWYVRCDALGRRADNLVSTGDIDLVPTRQKAIWHSWLSGITDWCVSRQLWWGHPIPMYWIRWNSAINRPGSWVAAENKQQAREKALKGLSAIERDVLASMEQDMACTVTQDKDVLDTWFSSGLLPLTTFNESKEDGSGTLEPHASLSSITEKTALSTVLETGQDILFFWVVRMAMLCTYFAKIPPFSTVLLHPMVRDAQGRKMSKSLGNIIDPMDIIDGAKLSKLEDTLKRGNLPKEELRNSTKELRRLYPQGFQRFGADALRFALILYTQQTQQINLSLDNVKASYHFCNKVWNAFRFVHMHAEKLEMSSESRSAVQSGQYEAWLDGLDRAHLTVFDRVLLSRLSVMLKAYHRAMETHRFAVAAEVVRDFVQKDLCDRYIEVSKPALFDNIDIRTSQELWQRHARDGATDDMSVMQSEWQAAQCSTGLVVYDPFAEKETEASTALVFGVISGIRSLKQQHSARLAASTGGGSVFTVAVTLPNGADEQRQMLQAIVSHKECIRRMGKEPGVCIRALDKNEGLNKVSQAFVP